MPHRCRITPARRSRCPRWRRAASRKCSSTDDAADCTAAGTRSRQARARPRARVVESGRRLTRTIGRAALSNACSGRRIEQHVLAHRVEPIDATLRKQYCERLVRPPFALAQRRHRGGLARIAHQVIAADALDGKHGTRLEQPHRTQQCFIRHGEGRMLLSARASAAVRTRDMPAVRRGSADRRGREYSAAHASHSANRAIVVFLRSYGSVSISV